MKKQNAFTLVELLGILTILSIILIVAIPTITGTLKRNKERQYKEYETTLKMAAERYISDNIDSYNILNNNTGDASATYISVTNLIRGGYLDKCLKNPLSGVETCDKIYIKVTRDENSILNYDVIESDTDNALIDVTFDANGGEVSTQSKLVMVGNKYGTLPTPTRAGYTFKGWNGKNLVPELTADNYTITHYRDRTTHEFKKENNITYIHVNGNSSTTNIDTLWILLTNDYLTFKSNTNYVLSFDVRSKNSVTDQYISKRNGENDGKTGIYLNDSSTEGLVSTIEQTYLFDNDGKWHSFSSIMSIPENITSGKLAIGNDVPNIHGENSYIDISNIQLEEGSTATAYEPYYITSNTTVVQSSNHTLKAIWQKN